jgi:adenine-specific DNA-methyltransferase
MPTLTWIGKSAVIDHHTHVPIHLLVEQPERGAGDPASDNLLIEGDNLLALKALLPRYAGQVKCIYIDPPYNTGDESWVYNDNVNSPEIRRWIGDAVGREAEDFSRHDKWLCMMHPRMQLLAQLLRPDGFLFVSLNDIELARFRLMMEEILPPRSFVTSLIWKSRRNLDNRSLHNVSVDHEYVLVYRLGDGRFRGTDKDLSKYSNPDNDPRGEWMSDNLVGLATKERRPNLHYDLINPETGDVYPPPDKGWRYSRETMAQKIAEGRILWPTKKDGRPRHKKFFNDLQDEFAGFSSFVECGNTNEGTEEVSRIMGGEQFIFPKPRSLVESLLQQVTSGDDLILDSFAGTGTTGHAVLALNRLDGGSRRFILVEIDPKIAQSITHQRLQRSITGYRWTDAQKNQRQEPGLGGGFRYCTLGATIFDSVGQIRPEVSFADLAQFVFFAETGQPLPASAAPQSPLLGVAGGRAVYLLYNGILKDVAPDSGNVLTRAVLHALPAPGDDGMGQRVVYGAACLLSTAHLRQANVVFRQIPYELRIG